MLNSVYFGRQIKRPADQQQQYITVPVKHDYPQFKEISPQAAYAINSYALAGIDMPLPQMPLDKLVSKLEKSGKRAGKDYKIDGCEMGNIVVTIKNKQGQDEKTIHYDCGDFSKWSCYESNKYIGNRKVKEIARNSNNKIDWYTDIYQNNRIPQNAFAKGGMTYDTTPQEYIKYLKENNIDYDIKYSGDNINNRSVCIDEWDSNNKLTYHNWWYYGERQFNEPPQFVTQRKYDENEAILQGVSFYNKNETEVTHYTHSP